MKSKLLRIKGTWREVADSARTTINKEVGSGEPTSSWKRRMLLSEHSPIRQILISAKWYEYKSCGYHKTKEYEKRLIKYREEIN